MLSGKIWRRTLSSLGVMIAVLAVAAPVFAQSAVIKGRVLDQKGEPIDGAKITITREGDTSNRKWETSTNKKGEYLQAGLPYSGAYKVIAEKEKVGSETYTARVRLGAQVTVDFQLIPGKSQLTKEQLEQNAVLKQLLAAGFAAIQAGDHSTAIAKFTEAGEKIPSCADCYYNIGVSQSQLKAYDAAEAAFKKTIELKPDYVEAYNGLAAVYNAQRKIDLASQAAAKAAELGGASAGGASAETSFNQGVILWNAGKIGEAKVQFEAALKADPNHAPSHFQYGMALLNEGKLPEAISEFETYVKLAPDAPNTAQAKAMLGQLKK